MDACVIALKTNLNCFHFWALVVDYRFYLQFQIPIAAKYNTDMVLKWYGHYLYYSYCCDTAIPMI